MTTCSTFANSIKKRVEEGKDLDEIAGELCSDVKFNRQKVIRVIKDFLGDEYLEEHSETLGYDIGKAKLGKIPKAPKLRKIETEIDSEPKKSSCKVSKLTKKESLSSSSAEPKKDTLENTIRELVEEYGYDRVRNVLDGCV